MKKTKKLIVLFLIGIILSFNTNVAKSVEVDNVIPKSDNFKNWESLSDEEKKESIQPSLVDTKIEGFIKKSNYSKILKSSTLESKYDLRDKINIKVKNQQNSNSCWAFSLSSIVESFFANKNGKDSKEYSPMHIEYKATDMYNKTLIEGGNVNLGVAYSVAGYGPVYESDFTFESVYNEDTNDAQNFYLAQSNSVNKNIDARAMINDTIQFASIYKQYNENEVRYEDSPAIIGAGSYTDDEVKTIRNAIKQHIKNYGAITSAMYTDLSYINGQLVSEAGYFNSETNSYYCNNSLMGANHAVTIVGWDDNYDKNNFASNKKPIHNGAYIVLNSWGKDILDNGYIYISYDDAVIEQMLYGIKDITEYKTNYKEEFDNLYQYDELGASAPIYFLKDQNNYFTEGYMANVFERKDNKKIEYLNDVGVFLQDTEGIEIYVNPSNDDLDIDKAKLVGSYTGSNALEAGYHKVKLSSPVRILGDKFSVIVKYINQEGASASLECNLLESNITNESNYFDTAKSNAKESFISTDGKNWSDLYNYNYFNVFTFKNTNACIKAFTKLSDSIKTEGIEINSKTANVNKGSEITLTAIITPSDATNKKVTWTSSDENIASVDEHGVVTGINKGTVTITAKTEDGNLISTCTVTVNEIINVTNITLDKNTLSMEIGDKGNLAAEITPSNATNKKVTWTSSDENIVSIDENGIITAKSKGTAEITVTTEDGAKVAKCKVTVSEKTNTDDDIYKSDEDIGKTSTNTKEQSQKTVTNVNKANDTTTAKTQIPNTGIRNVTIFTIIIAIISLIIFIRYKSLKDVK